jgi:hypothetical protein
MISRLPHRKQIKKIYRHQSPADSMLKDEIKKKRLKTIANNDKKKTKIDIREN